MLCQMISWLLMLATGLVGYWFLLTVLLSSVLLVLGKQRGPSELGPWQPLLRTPSLGPALDVIGVSCLYIRTHVMALLKHATDVASTEKSLLFMCALVLVLLIVCWKNMKCICLVNIVCSPLKLWTKQELRHHAAGALFKSVWKPHANI